MSLFDEVKKARKKYVTDNLPAYWSHETRIAYKLLGKYLIECAEESENDEIKLESNQLPNELNRLNGLLNPKCRALVIEKLTHDGLPTTEEKGTRPSDYTLTVRLPGKPTISELLPDVDFDDINWTEKELPK